MSRINNIRINNIKQRWCWLRRGLNSVLFERPMPSAMVSWRLLFPTADPCIRTHRAIWRHATSPRLPLPVAFAIESFLWLRWVCWYAWVSSRAWVRERGPDVVASGGPGYGQQYLRVLQLAVLHTIHPSDAYAFQLTRKDRRWQMWRYVYSHETHAYHAWRSTGRADWLAATELLSDKVALTQHLQQLGLPAAEILEVVPKGGCPDFARWLARYPALFCKTRSGARAEGAFAVEPSEIESESDNAAGFSLTMFRGNEPGKADTASQLQALLDNSEYLVQPRLENHPRLATLSAPGDLVELRVVTECEHGQVTIRTAYLYSVARDADDEWALLLFPVTLAGVVLAAPIHNVAPRFREQANTVLAALADQPLPDWSAICAAVLKAHQGVLCGAATIAWDIVITPDGPRILEGNPGWGVMQPQMLHGPFLPAV